jgi:hypothetical protein
MVGKNITQVLTRLGKVIAQHSQYLDDDNVALVASCGCGRQASWSQSRAASLLVHFGLL